MNIYLFYILAIVLQLFAVQLAFGQVLPCAAATGKYMAIFRDDFSSDSLNTFPHQWLTFPSLMTIDLKTASRPPVRDNALVQDIGQIRALAVRSHGCNIPLSPRMGNINYLPDSFAIDFDAITESEKSDIALVLYNLEGNYLFYNRIYGNRDIASVFAGDPGIEGTRNGVCPASVVCNQWHHYSFVFRHDTLQLNIDGRPVTASGGFAAHPASMAIAANTSAFHDTYVAFGNFEIYTGNRSEQFNTMLTAKKLVTHDILFDVNKATLQPSSGGYLSELANWLQQNPRVKLEIDGHTDSDGARAENLKLSKARAGAVKQRLVSLGVGKDRLTTNGFGSSKPIRPNVTDADKRLNRRVEFVNVGK